MILLWIIIPIFILYSLLILYYWQSWRSIPAYVAQSPPQIKISVIVAARNEEYTIGSLLTALQQQTYPKELYEVIVIDDHSDDRTVEIVRQFHDVILLQLKDNTLNAYKKKAIETGVAAASGNLIVTTDADCLPPAGWLETIAAFKEDKKAVFIAAPVVIDSNGSVVQVFQSLDFMVLQGITAAVVHGKKLSMCNGANLCYERKVFYEVGGFAGIDHIASGDDMLLMHKIEKKYPAGIHYLKSTQAIVHTQAVKTWKDFFKQRVRWASKAREYEDKRILPVLLLVYFFNLSFLALLIVGFWNNQYWIIALILLALKTTIELPFFLSLSVFFNKQASAKWFLLFQPLHIFYIIVSGFLGQFGKYEWKGRKVR